MMKISNSKLDIMIVTGFLILFTSFFLEILHISQKWYYNDYLKESDYFKYYSVQPELSKNKIGEDMYVVSDSERKKESRKMERSDVLKCHREGREDEGYKRYVEFASNGYNLPKKTREVTKERRYAQYLPNYETECIIHSCSTMHVRLPSNNEAVKTDCINSEPFWFIE